MDSVINIPVTNGLRSLSLRDVNLIISAAQILLQDLLPDLTKPSSFKEIMKDFVFVVSDNGEQKSICKKDEITGKRTSFPFLRLYYSVSSFLLVGVALIQCEVNIWYKKWAYEVWDVRILLWSKFITQDLSSKFSFYRAGEKQRIILGYIECNFELSHKVCRVVFA